MLVVFNTGTVYADYDDAFMYCFTVYCMVLV